MLKNIILRCMLVFLLQIACSTEQTAQGPGSETVAFAGKVIYPSGDGVPGASVIARKRNYLAALPTSQSPQSVQNETTTSADGSFRIEISDTGSYSIEITDHMQHAALLSCSTGTENRTINISEDTLWKTGSINGQAMFSTHYTPSFVRVYGMERVFQIDSTDGTFIISNMPKGTYDLEITTDSEIVVSHKINSLKVLPDSTSNVGTLHISSGAIWAHACTLILNTTASGADIPGDLFGFPILVRLTESNFDFSEAAGDGGDIRFFKTDNTPLPHKIERWDSWQKKAEIWVRTDTIFGASSTQKLKMYWGSKAPSEIPAAQVFDTTSGFQAVFHFAESSRHIWDATINNFYGEPGDTLSYARKTDGPIGSALAFNGTSDYYSLPRTAESSLNFSENNSYTISAWVYADALDSAYHTILSKGDFHYGLQIHNIDQWELFHFRSGSGWNAVRAPAAAQEWKLITGVYDNGHMLLYVDGAQVSNEILTIDTTFTGTPQDVSIGKMTGYSDRFFAGKLDEVRISSVARNGDWIKLCYMNQRQDDALLEFR